MNYNLTFTPQNNKTLLNCILFLLSGSYTASFEFIDTKEFIEYESEKIVENFKLNSKINKNELKKEIEWKLSSFIKETDNIINKIFRKTIQSI
jgi:hypothetical protein